MKNLLPLVIAHRGASAYLPENTMAAFQLAWDMGADGIEGDFHLTRDEQLICVHDPVVYDEEGSAYVIAEHDYDDLVGKEFYLSRKSGNIAVRLCGLSQVFEELPSDNLIVIEIKTGPENVEPLLQTIEKSKVPLSQIQVIAFDYEFIAQLKEREPRICALWIVDFSYQEVTGWSPKWATVSQQLLASKADGLSTNCHHVIDEGCLLSLKEKKLLLNVWTVDEPSVAEQFMALEYDSISTNKPDWLYQMIHRTS